MDDRSVTADSLRRQVLNLRRANDQLRHELARKNDLILDMEMEITRHHRDFARWENMADRAVRRAAAATAKLAQAAG